MKIMKNKIREIDTGKGSQLILSKINETKNPLKLRKCHLKNYSLISQRKQYLTISKLERNAEEMENIQRNSNFNQTTTIIQNSERLEKKEMKLNRSENKSQKFQDPKMKLQMIKFLNTNKISFQNRKLHNYSFQKNKYSKEFIRSSTKNQRLELQGLFEFNKMRNKRVMKKFSILLKRVNANRICIRPLMTKIKSFEKNKKICQVYNRGEHKEVLNNILHVRLQNDISEILQKFKKPIRKKIVFKKNNLVI